MMDRRHFIFSSGALALFAAVPSPLAAAPFVSRRISVEVRGTGPDVILIPGLTASRAMWAETVAAVPGYRYHLVQVAGFGGEPAGANGAGAVVAPVAAEIARYIAEAGLKAPAIIGHSMGGTLALILAARYPGQVGRLMVVDMLPQPAGLVGSDAAGIRPLADGLFGFLGGSAMGRQLTESLMGQYGGDARGGPKSDPDVVARATHELAVLDLTPALARIKAPLSIVYALPPAGGGVDPAAVARRFRVAYAGAPTASLTGIANSGHMIMDDQPAQFRAAVKAFLAN